MTKKYIHTTLGRKAELIDKEEDVYCFVDDDANEHNFYGNELCSLGFIEAPTEEVRGDSITHWTKEFTFDNKDKKVDYITVGDTKYVPVEQEIIPLDVEAIVKEITDDIGFKYDTQALRNILSKYGVPKQEESFEEKFGKQYGTYRKFQTSKVQERLVKSGYIMHDEANNNEALRDFLKYYHMIQD